MPGSCLLATLVTLLALEGKGMRETEEKRGWAENKLVGRDELWRDNVEENPRREADERAIPDYVMRDFGLPEEDEAEDRDYGIRT